MRSYLAMVLVVGIVAMTFASKAPAATSCAAQDAHVIGLANRACCLDARVRWNGRACEPFVQAACGCASCSGANCDQLFASAAACARAHVGCP
jgi:hypothetical protein